MDISEIRIKLMNEKEGKLQAFCSLTFEDSFVIRDLKIIGGSKGSFVAMPSRKLMDHCTKCNTKNHLKARYCNHCGSKLDPNRADKDLAGRQRLHTDIAHPINSACRERIQNAVIRAFEEEIVKSKEPGYVPPSLDDGYNEEPREAFEARGSKAKKDKEGTSFDAGIFS